MDFFTPEAIQEFVAKFGMWAPLIFAVLQFLQVIVTPIPGNVFAVAGGVLFGFWKGFLLSWGAIVLGSLFCFYLGKKLGTKGIKKLVKPATFDKYMGFISGETTKNRIYVFFIFACLLPFFPDDLLCLLAGLTTMNFKAFSAIILLTRPWGLLFASFIGSGTIDIPMWVLGILFAAMLIIGVICIKNADKLEHFSMNLVNKVAKRFARDDKEKRP